MVYAFIQKNLPDIRKQPPLNLTVQQYVERSGQAVDVSGLGVDAKESVEMSLLHGISDEVVVDLRMQWVWQTNKQFTVLVQVNEAFLADTLKPVCSM